MSRQTLHEVSSNLRSSSGSHSSNSSSSSSSSGAESGDEGDIKWSDRGYSMSDILNKFSLPQVVRLHAHGRVLYSSLPVPFNIAHEQILLFSSRDVQQLVAKNVLDTANQDIWLDTYLDDVVIPEDYSGLFVQPFTIGTSPDLVSYHSIESLMKCGSKGFLTMALLQGIVKMSSSVSSTGQQGIGSYQKMYPRGSIFLIEEVQDWSAKMRSSLHNRLHVRSAIRNYSSSSQKLSVHFADLTNTNEYETNNSGSKNSKTDIQPQPQIRSALSPFLMQRPKNNKDKTDEDESSRNAVNRENNNRPSMPRSASAGSKSSDCGLVAKCKDANGRYVYFPFYTIGIFIQVFTHPTNPKKLSIQIKELVTQKKLPPMIRFVYGKKMRLMLASGFLKPKSVQKHRSVIACAINKSSYVLFEIPVTSNMKFCMSLNKGLLTSPHLQRALHICEKKALDFSTDIKVVVKLSSKPIGQETIANSGLDTFGNLEDIAEERPEDGNDTESSDEETIKYRKQMPVNGIIYI